MEIEIRGMESELVIVRRQCQGEGRRTWQGGEQQAFVFFGVILLRVGNKSTMDWRRSWSCCIAEAGFVCIC